LQAVALGASFSVRSLPTLGPAQEGQRAQPS